MFIVCVDGSEHADRAVKYAAKLAQNFGVDLTILNVIAEAVSYAKIPAGYKPKKEKAEEIVSRAKKLAEEVTREIGYHERVICGPVYQEIIRISEAEEVDGIIMGTRGVGGLKRIALGTVADKVIRHSHCPVTVVR